MIRRTLARATLVPRWLQVRAAWARGQRRPLPPVELADAEAIAEGRTLQADAIRASRDRHAGVPLRVFVVRPPTISGHLWFDGLAAALTHMGVRTTLAGDDPASWPDAWRALQPTLLLAPDEPAVLEHLGVDRLAGWAAAGGRRLLVHLAPAGFPDSDRRGAADDARLALAIAGRGADAFCSIYEPEYFTRYAEAWRRAGFAYLPLPQACNPFQDAPVERSRTHAWFMASTLTADRLAVAVDTLRPILRAGPGLWVGSGWRFGDPRVDPAELPALFASARVALAPLVPFLRHQPLEITYRVFAAAACGAFQVTHRTPVSDRFFAADELIQAADDREFVALVEHYLPRPDERAAVARRALRRVYRDHTIFARADRLVRFLQAWPERR